MSALPGRLQAGTLSGSLARIAVRALGRPRRRERIVTGRLVGRPGGAVHIIDRGRGPAVVLLHGLGGLAQEIFAPLHPLARRCRVVAIDRAGYGGSDPLPARDMAPDRQAVWLRAALDAAQVRHPVLVAHSIGASTALHFAVRWPGRLRGLVLIAPFCRPTRPAAMPLLRAAVAPIVGGLLRDKVVPAIAPLIATDRIADAFAPDPVPPSMRRYPVSLAVRPEALLAMAGELNGFNEAMIPLRSDLRTVEVPTIVLAGAADTVARPDRHVRWLASRMPAIEVRTVPGAGHMLHHVRPKAVMAAVRELAGLGLPKRLARHGSREFCVSSLELASQEE